MCAVRGAPDQPLHWPHPGLAQDPRQDGARRCRGMRAFPARMWLCAAKDRRAAETEREEKEKGRK
eukprot:2188506-Rhodomonas_salina.1